MVIQSGLSPELMPLFGIGWIEKMKNAYMLTAMHPDSNVLDRSAARIFYRISKNHNLIDGNKRSAIFCTYLFVVMNGFVLEIPANALYRLAKRVASSKKDQELMIERIARLFNAYIVHPE